MAGDTLSQDTQPVGSRATRALRLDARTVGFLVMGWSLFSLAVQVQPLITNFQVHLYSDWTVSLTGAILALTPGVMAVGALLSLWGGWLMLGGRRSGRPWVLAALALGILAYLSSIVPWGGTVVVSAALGTIFLLGVAAVVMISRFDPFRETGHTVA